MRCLALADALRARNARCCFVCRSHPGNLLNLIRQRGYEVHALDCGDIIETTEAPPGVSSPIHAPLLGVSWRTDADQTRAVLGDAAVDWLIVDHYALDERWERCLRSVCNRLMVIDDLADRPHDCELLLDQNWFADDTATRYDHFTPINCIKCLGPQFALLGPEYAQLRALMPPRDGFVHRVLVFLGGSDPTNQTAKVLRALLHPDLSQLTVDVVIGANHPDPDGIAGQAGVTPRTHLHKNLPSLAGLMTRADLMIGAGGSTTWERMALGLPSVVISIAKNQTASNIALAAAGYINFIGDMADVAEDDVVKAVCMSLSEPNVLKAQACRALQMVAANGSTKICDILLSQNLKN